MREKGIYSCIVYPGSRRPRAFPVDECASVWPACLPQAGMSPHLGVKKGATDYAVGLHLPLRSTVG